MDLKNTKTKENLMTALQGEALAHLKYQFYRSLLANTSKEIEGILDEIIHNEKEHGKIWFKLLHDGEIPNNIENLKDAIAGERYEYNKMYRGFADVAEEEGFLEIAELFRQVGEIEKRHCEDFSEILEHFELDDLFWNYGKSVSWKCLNCGHVVEGDVAPEECPICKHGRKYFTKL